MARLFTGYSLPAEVARELHAWAAEHLAPLGVRVVPTENLHITSAFFGEVSDSVKDWLIEVVASLPPEEFHVESAGLRSLGRGAIAVLLKRRWETTLPGPAITLGSAENHVIGILGQAFHADLAELVQIDPVILPAGDRHYLLGRAAQLCHPISGRRHHGDYHVTVARCRDMPFGLAAIGFPRLTLELCGPHLYESELGPGGSRYTVHATAEG